MKDNDKGWVVVAKLSMSNKADWTLTQFWTGKGWSIVEAIKAKRFLTKKAAEEAAVGAVLAENLFGWVVSAIPATDAQSALSVEIREA